MTFSCRNCKKLGEEARRELEALSEQSYVDWFPLLRKDKTRDVQISKITRDELEKEYNLLKEAIENGNNYGFVYFMIGENFEGNIRTDDEGKAFEMIYYLCGGINRKEKIEMAHKLLEKILTNSEEYKGGNIDRLWETIERDGLTYCFSHYDANIGRWRGCMKADYVEIPHMFMVMLSGLTEEKRTVIALDFLKKVLE